MNTASPGANARIWRAKASTEPSSAQWQGADSAERLRFQAEYTAEAARRGLSMPASASPPEPAAPGRVVSFSEGAVSIAAAGGQKSIRRLAESEPYYGSGDGIFHVDMFAQREPREAMPLLYSEALDEHGGPLRWAASSQAWLAENGDAYGMCEVSPKAWTDGVRNFAGKLSWAAVADKSGTATKYKRYVEQYAKRYKLTSSLVFAIMHTESNFNPGAVSASNALGLMQVVAASAGGEVYTFLTGKKGTPSMETLFDPEHNIHYGTAYLHLLAERYFGDVLNKTSRDICVIAAYNGGPGAVLRVFDKDMVVAVAKINALAPEDVYKNLVEKMPTAESRRYVSTVLNRMQSYN